MSATEPQYEIVFFHGGHSCPRPWPRLLAILAEMRQDLGPRELAEILRLPDPVERVR